jgi:hypothetical protein
MPPQQPMPPDRLVVQLLVPGPDIVPTAVETRIALGGHARFREPGEVVYLGVPLAVRAGPRGFGEELSYIVVGRTAAARGATVYRAGRLLDELVAELKTTGPPGFLTTIEAFVRERRRAPSNEQRAAFALMFYQWVRDRLPAEYLNGRGVMWQDFVAHLYNEMLGLDLEKRPRFAEVCELIAESDARFSTERSVRLFLQLQFNLAFVGTPAGLDVVPDVFLEPANLPGLHSGKDIALAWFLIVAGIFSGATEMALLSLAIDIALATLEFLADMGIAERDGIITEDETTLVAWSFGFVFAPVLPFALTARGLHKLALFLTTAPLPILFHEFLTFLQECFEELIEYQARMKVARAAGFETYHELDLDSTIAIPISALQPGP